MLPDLTPQFFTPSAEACRRTSPPPPASASFLRRPQFATSSRQRLAIQRGEQVCLSGTSPKGSDPPPTSLEMREPEETFQRTAEEEEQRKKNKNKRVKEEETNEEVGAAAESSSEGKRDASEVGLGLMSENDDENKREKRKKKKKRVKDESGAAVDSLREDTRDAAEDELGLINENDGKKKREKMKEKKTPTDVEAREGIVGTAVTAGRGVEDGAKLASADYEKEEKVKKEKKRRKDKANAGEGANAAGHREEERTNEGKRRVIARKGEEIANEQGEFQESWKRKRKDKVHRVLENMSENQEGRVDRRMDVGLEEHCVQHGQGNYLKRTETRRKERDRNGGCTESFSEHRATEEEKPVAKDRRIADEGSSHGSQDDRKKKKKKNLEEEKSVESGEINKKKKKGKDKLTGHEKPILRDLSDRGCGNENELTMTVEESAGDGNRRIAAISTSRDEKKTRKKKKKHNDGTTEDTKVVDEGTSSVRNVDETNAATTTGKRKKAKRVNFSGHVEVFPSTGDAKSNDQSNGGGLVQGKRFSKEEDDMVRQAVFDYVEQNHLGEDGVNMVLKCRSHPQARNCWKEIGAALPWRPRESVYSRAHILFQRGEARKWEAEELDLIRRYYEKHGPKWREMAELLGKHRFHVKDTWRRIKLTNANKGQWSQEEYQALFDLVNMDLQLKVFEEKDSRHGMLRDNISWGAISDKLSTRHDAACCMKWYRQLTSPLVILGLWADTDDYCLIDELLKLDASCIEDVEWDSLLDNRSGHLCLKRWKEMVRYIGGHREKSFMEQVELLATRYCPKMLQYRTQNPKECEENVDGSQSSPT